jgi:hypothetical protein
VYKIHIYEFFDGGGDAADLVDLDAAVYDVIREFNNVGGTTAKVDVAGITTDARAYESDTPLVTIRQYRCTGCGHVWRQDTSAAP